MNRPYEFGNDQPVTRNADISASHIAKKENTSLRISSFLNVNISSIVGHLLTLSSDFCFPIIILPIDGHQHFIGAIHYGLVVNYLRRNHFGELR